MNWYQVYPYNSLISLNRREQLQIREVTGMVGSKTADQDVTPKLRYTHYLTSRTLCAGSRTRVMIFLYLRKLFYFSWHWLLTLGLPLQIRINPRTLSLVLVTYQLR